MHYPITWTHATTVPHCIPHIHRRLCIIIQPSRLDNFPIKSSFSNWFWVMTDKILWPICRKRSIYSLSASSKPKPNENAMPSIAFRPETTLDEPWGYAWGPAYTHDNTLDLTGISRLNNRSKRAMSLKPFWHTITVMQLNNQIGCAA